MPVRPERRAAYPPGWKALSAWIRFERAGGRCECDGRCGRARWHLGRDGRCRARDGDCLPGGWHVVLAVAHLTHEESVDDPDLLRAFCPGCHNAYDGAHRAETRRSRKPDPDGLLLW